MGKKQSKLSPKGMDNLRRKTDFSDDEIFRWYKILMKDYPSGRILLGDMQRIYDRQFPNEDAGQFAEHVFRTMHSDKEGSIDFRDLMCGVNATLRGKPEHKLAWAFSMYDGNCDGFIQRRKMIDMLNAVYRMFGPVTCWAFEHKSTPEQMTEEVFAKMDTNRDGKISLDEYLEGTKIDPFIVRVLLGDREFSN